jgi:hypothetical protein
VAKAVPPAFSLLWFPDATFMTTCFSYGFDDGLTDLVRWASLAYLQVFQCIYYELKTQAVKWGCDFFAREQ